MSVTKVPAGPTPLVYIVEDDEAVCYTVALALDLEGFAIKVCPTGEGLGDAALLG